MYLQNGLSKTREIWQSHLFCSILKFDIMGYENGIKWVSLRVHTTIRINARPSEKSMTKEGPISSDKIVSDGSIFTEMLIKFGIYRTIGKYS